MIETKTRQQELRMLQISGYSPDRINVVEIINLNKIKLYLFSFEQQ